MLGFSILYLFTDREWMLYASVGMGILGLLSSQVNQWIHLIWLFIGEKLGYVVNKVVMGTLYMVVLLPISLLARIFRKDIMQLKPGTKSGMHQRNHLFGPGDFENPW